MKTLLALGIISMSFIQQAQASFIPGWERPIFTAKMEVAEVVAYQNMHNIQLTLTRKDGTHSPSGMILTYSLEDNAQAQNIEKQYVISKKTVDGCGSIHYTAQLLQDANQENQQERGSIELIDHTQRKCKDYRPFKWDAKVHSGFGFCGTMDTVTDLIGNPEPVVTIQ